MKVKPSFANPVPVRWTVAHRRLGGGEVPPGLPVSFHTADFKETVETLVMKLCFEAGAVPIRFQKKT